MSSPDFSNVFIKTVFWKCIIKFHPTINIKLINPRNMLSGSVFCYVGWQPRFKSKLFLIQKSLESRLAGGKSWWKRFRFKGWPGVVEYFGLISSCLIVSYVVALLYGTGRQGLKKTFRFLANFYGTDWFKFMCNLDWFFNDFESILSKLFFL